MNTNQIDLIASYLDSTHLMLEYGAGGSTIYFSQYVKKYISIEHDINWITKLKEQKLPSNVELYYCAPNNNLQLPVWEGKYQDFENYINYVDLLPYKRYDRVLIDGRARQYCAKKILNFIDQISIVFVHDFFERNKYLSVLNDYILIDKEDREKPTLAIFKKK